MDVNDIYGPITDGKKVIICVGNYNIIHGVLSSKIEFVPLARMIAEQVIELTINHQENGFYLSVAGGKFISAVPQDDSAYPVISAKPSLFVIDSLSGSQKKGVIMAGVLSSLFTTIRGIVYPLVWKWEETLSTELVAFLPTTWYEISNGCKPISGIPRLLGRLKKLNFRGFSTEEWCNYQNSVIHCAEGEYCGTCFGPCVNQKEICQLTPKDSVPFSCENPDTSEKFLKASETSEEPSEYLLWGILAAVIVVIILLFIGLLYKQKVVL